MNEYFEIILVKNSENRTDTLRLIRGITGSPLEDIKKLTDTLPVVIHSVFMEKEAESIKNKFQAIGAEVEISKRSFDEEIDSQNDRSKDEKADSSELKSEWKEIKKTIKTVFKTIEVIALIVIVYLFATGKFATLTADLLAAINSPDDNPYIEMVQSLTPFNNTSYAEAFAAEFDRNEWSYFKSDGQRIVQVVSTYNNIKDKMITQFLLTPQEDDQFYIELYAVNVSGANLSNIEKNMVIAALFDGDMSQILLETLLYDN